MEFFEQFQELRKILCICPSCGELQRLSDLELKIKGAKDKTWLDEYEQKTNKLAEEEEKFSEIEEKIREIAREKGRREAQKAFNNAITPGFKTLKLDPFDVKPILNPVDFIAFKGMNKNGGISEIAFICKETNIPTLNLIQDQIKNKIENGKYNLEVVKVDETGNLQFE